MLLKGQCYTHQQVRGLSRIFTPALQWIFIWWFMSLVGWEEGFALATGAKLLKSSYPVLLGWFFFFHRKSLTDCIIKPEKESEMDQPPPGVLLKNMTPCEEIKALISGHVCTILRNVRCLDCQQVEWVKQKSHNKCTLWPLVTKSQKQVHRTNVELPGDSCFVSEKHIRTFSWLQGGPACRTIRVFQWSRDPFRLLVKRVRASYRSYFLKQEARGLIVREEKEGTASSSYPWQRAHN